MTPPELEAVRLDRVAALAPAVAIAQLVAIRRALATCGDPGVLAALAASIPPHVAALVPEVCLALAEVALELAPYAPRVPDDVHALEPRLRTLWLRVALTAGDDERVARLDDAALLQVVTGWSLDGVAAPQALLARLAGASDVRLRTAVLPAVTALVQQLALTGAEAFAALEPLAGDPDAGVRIEALRLMSRHWLLGLSPGAQRRRELAIRTALRDPEPRLVAAGVDATAELAQRGWLADVLEDEAAPPASRAAAMAALGALAEPGDLDTVLAVAAQDPLRYGAPTRSFVLDAHRHGVFVREPQLPAVLARFDGHVTWTGEELVRVTYVVRGALMAQLAELPAGDPRWLRRAQILAASLGVGAARVLEHVLASTDDPRIAIAAIDAAGRSPEYGDEALLLRWLDAVPEAVIPVLRVKGGIASVARLRAIVEDPFTPQALRKPAMDVLWALEPDRAELRRALSRALGPHASGLLDTRQLARRDPTAARLLVEHAWDDLPDHAIEPLAQLTIYCESGDLAFLPEVTRLFRELFRGYVRDALEGDFSVKRLQLPELEQLVFRYGRHLVDHGRSIRRWIASGPETGRDLVLQLVCDWLAEQPSDPIRVALLETAARHNPEGAVLRFLEPAWRRGDANVRRAAIEVLVAANDGARGLELSLGKLAADASDPRIECQALAALRTLRATWAEPIVRAALARPEMAVKKEAADALAEIGQAASIPALVDWLARHDNASFRVSLVRALHRAAGPAYVAVLVDALERATEARSTELLWRALDGQLTLRTALRLARSPHPAHLELVEACLDRRVTLAGATADDLAAQLHRARLRTLDPRPDPARRLRLHGFSPDAARALVALRTGAPGPLAAASRSRAAGDAGSPAHASARGSASSRAAGEAGLPAPASARSSAGSRAAGDAGTPAHASARSSATSRGAGDAGTPAHGVAGSSNAAPALGAAELDAAILPVVRLGLASWITWLSAEPEPAAIQLVLDAADATQAEQAGALLTLAGHPGVEPEAVAAYLERCITIVDDPALKLRAIERLRGLAASSRLGGLRRYRLLGRLGAVRTVRDLEACLAECRIRPDVAGESAALLTEALAVPAPRTDDPPALVALREHIADWYRAGGLPPWLTEALAARPLDLPVAPLPRPTPRPAFRPGSQADLDGLLATLQHRDLAERTRAAHRLLAWSDARTAWPTVVAAYLDGRVALDADGLARVAALLTTWPAGEPARALVPWLSPLQLRRFAPAWLDAWAAGDPAAAELLRVVPEDRLVPLVAERARAGRYVFARLVRIRRGPAARALIALAASSPEDVAHLHDTVEPPHPDAAAGDPVDPIAGKTLDELVALIDQKGVESGLAVRAVHALTGHKQRGIEPLERFTRDRRPPVRSAALRALRVVASRERTLEATAKVLELETRRDVVLSLMSSLGHGRHAPSLPSLLERMTDRDHRIQQGAHAALRAWGRDILPALRHAARRARPDRRPTFASLIAELEAP